MNEKPYTLIIPTLNRPESLKLLYHSIDSKYPIKILLIDNGSGKETTDLILRASKDPRTFVTFEKFNKGASYSRNECMQFAFEELDSEGVFFIDSDVVLSKDCLDNLISCHLENKKAILFSSDQKKEGFSYREFLDPDFRPTIQTKVFTTTECCFMPRAVYKSVGRFDEMFYPVYCEDMDYFYRAKLKGWPLLSCPDAYHYHFSDSIPNEEIEFDKYKSMRFSILQEYYIYKWGGPPGNEIFTKPFNSEWEGYTRS